MSLILITGGAGFIGSHLAAALARNHEHRIVIADNFSTGSAENIAPAPNIELLEADVNRAGTVKDIFRKGSFDYVFHFAAVVGVQRTLDHPFTVLDDMYGLRNIIEFSCRQQPRRIFFASSSEVYGESLSFPQHEADTPLNARLPYAGIKSMGEIVFRTYGSEFQRPVTLFRFFNVYGPRQSTDFVIPRYIDRALRNQDITIYGDGLQTRTFCYIDDVVEAIIQAMEHPGGSCDVINVGSAEEVTIRYLAELIVELTGSGSRLAHIAPLEIGDMRRRIPDNTRMQQLLGRKPLPLRQGLQRFVASLRQGR